MTALLEIDDAFRSSPRPEHFTNHNHCDECAEHDETLLSHTPHTIGLEQLGNPGWDPICFVTIEGFHYYLPALARLAMKPANYYLDQFLFHLNDERISSFNHAQRTAVLNLLTDIRDRIDAGIESDNDPADLNCFEELENRIERLR